MIHFEIVHSDRYQEAMEAPAKSLRDPELQILKVRRNKFGWPAGHSGGFAIVYELSGRDRERNRDVRLALRCFKKLAPDLQARYAKISEGLDAFASKSKFFLTTKYQQQGVRVDGQWKPITTLRWVDGKPLDMYLDDVSDKRYLMDRLRSQVRDLSLELDRWSVSHGDLQHRNILVTNDRALQLIDYDGMFVPTLRGQRSNEAGHPDFQHPERTPETAARFFGPGLDRFSLIAIYLQLSAIAMHPELWESKDRTEGLLLKNADFLDPDASAYVQRMRDYPELRRAVDRFRRICTQPLVDVPSLTTFLDETALTGDWRAPAPPPIPKPVAPPASSAAPPDRPLTPTLYMPVLEPNRVDLDRNIGEVVMVLGRFQASHRRTRDGESFTVLTLSALGDATFEILVEGRTAGQFAALGADWTVRPGSWLAVTGLIERLGSRYVVLLEQMAMLQRVPAEEARRRLAEWRERSKKVPPSGTNRPPVAQKPPAQKPEPTSSRAEPSKTRPWRPGTSPGIKDLAGLRDLLGIPKPGKESE